MAKRKKQSPYLHKQEEWAELYRQGMSFRQIGEIEGIYYGTVKNVIKDVIEIRPKQKFAHLTDEWVNAYQDGYSANDIAEKYKVDTVTVTKYLKQAGVELRSQPNRKRSFEHLTNTWIALYEEGKSLKEIADEYGTYPQTVHQYIKDKVDMRWYTETSRQYAINETYFDSLDSNEKAYWLGILFSSGSVINDITGGGIQLSMSVKDRDRVEAFQRVLETDKPIQERTDETNKSHQVILRVHNKHLYEKVKEYGLVENKTTTLTFPEFLNPAYLSSFVLGYFEGKGSVYKQKTMVKGKVYSNTYLHFWGTPSFLQSFQWKMKDLLNIDFYFTENHVSNFGSKNKERILSLNLGKREEIITFAKWLYEGKKDFSMKRDIRTYLVEEGL